MVPKKTMISRKVQHYTTAKNCFYLLFKTQLIKNSTRKNDIPTHKSLIRDLIFFLNSKKLCIDGPEEDYDKSESATLRYSQKN